MKKVVDIIFKVVLTLILVMPILGLTGLFPEPTADMYNTPEAFQFIQLLMESKYIMYLDSLIFVVSAVLLWTGREALAALLLLPVTVNIVGFHAFLDGGLFTGGAVMGNVMLLLNAYFLWKGCDKYKPLFSK